MIMNNRSGAILRQSILLPLTVRVELGNASPAGRKFRYIYKFQQPVDLGFILDLRLL